MGSGPELPGWRLKSAVTVTGIRKLTRGPAPTPLSREVTRGTRGAEHGEGSPAGVGIPDGVADRSVIAR
jgi:hypothetical protein